MENSTEVLKKLKIELFYDPVIQLLGIYPENTVTQKDACALMFVANYYSQGMDAM